MLDTFTDSIFKILWLAKILFLDQYQMILKVSVLELAKKKKSWTCFHTKHYTQPQFTCSVLAYFCLVVCWLKHWPKQENPSIGVLPWFPWLPFPPKDHTLINTFAQTFYSCCVFTNYFWTLDWLLSNPQIPRSPFTDWHHNALACVHSLVQSSFVWLEIEE